MARIILIVSCALYFSVGNIAFARAGANLSVVTCPKGFKKVAANLCMAKKWNGEKGKIYYFKDKRVTENKTYFEAQASCRKRAAHVCTISEFHSGWEAVKNDLSRHDMIGNYIADDHHLCVNIPKLKDNFEGMCHKHYKYRYKCCMSPKIPGGIPGLGGFSGVDNNDF